jgi:membrane associated rhomboid family serine protease
LVAINVTVFLAEIIIFRPELGAFFSRYGVVPTQILQGQQLYSLLTAMFLHGGWFHLITNMLMLWILGNNVEAALGKIPYLLLYVGGSVAASMTHVLVNATSSVPSLGTSGAIEATLAAYLAIFPLELSARRIVAVVILGAWIVMQFLSGVVIWVHIGGFAFGLLLGFLLKDQAERGAVRKEPRPVVGRGAR